MKNLYETHGALTIIHAKHLGKPVVIFIDTEDLEKLCKHKGKIWIQKSTTGTLYAFLKINNKHVALHRFILGIFDKTIEIDHKNSYGNDDRKNNLRIATHSQNLQNVKKHKNNKSGYLNVYAAKNKWRVEIRINKTKIYGGRFNNLEDARQKALKMRIKYLPFSKETTFNKKAS